MLTSIARGLPRLSCPGRYCSSSAVLGSQENPFDVIIAGGGMVGTALACAIGAREELASRNCLLLESSNNLPQMPASDADVPKLSNRVSALTPGSVSFLNDLGAWPLIEGVRSQSFAKMHVWERVQDTMVTFNACSVDPLSLPGHHLHSSPTMGVVTENWLVHAALNQVLQRRNSPNVTMRTGTKVKSASIPNGTTTTATPGQGSGDPSPWATVTLEDGTVLHCRLLVGADGPSSLIRQSVGISTVSHNYQQSAVVATLQWEENDQDAAYQRFLTTGPIALLPLTDSMASLVWSTTSEHAKELCRMDADEFLHSINSAFAAYYPQSGLVNMCNSTVRSLLAGYTSSSYVADDRPPRSVSCPQVVCLDEGSRGCFPLSLCHAKDYIDQRVALVGDAAHRVHPLAGQGVNLGYGDARELTSAMVEAVTEGQDVGSLRHLEDYESRRLWHVLPIMGAIHTLKHLYGTSFAPVELLRSIGLQITDAAHPLKAEIMTRAMQ